MSMVQERVDKILQRPMTRQQFLKQIGLLLLTAVGITTIVNTLEPKRMHQSVAADPSGVAYGASAYGGQKLV